MKVGSLVTYRGEWVPNIFPGDATRQPEYGIILEIEGNCEGTNICVHWVESENIFWHEQYELEVLSE